MSNITWILDDNISQYYKLSKLPEDLIKYAASQYPAAYQYSIPGEDKDPDMVYLNNRKISEWIYSTYPGTPGTTIENLPLYNGLTQHTIYGNSMDNKLLRYISYQELNLYIDLTDLPTLNIKYKPSITNETVGQHDISLATADYHWTILIKCLLSNILNVDIIAINYIKNIDNKRQYNVVGNNQIIYVSSLTYYTINNMNLQAYYGWRYLTDSKMVFKALNMLELDSNLPIRYTHGIYIIPFIEDYDDMVSKFSLQIRQLVSDGYEAIDISDQVLKDNDMMNLYYELLERFDYTITDKAEPQDTKNNYVKLKRPLIVKAGKLHITSLRSWLTESISLIINNQLPYINIKITYPENNNDLNDRKYKLLYASVMTYSILSNDYPYLRSSIYGITVRNDLSIDLQLSSLKELDIFNQLLSNVITNVNVWQVYSFSNLIDMLYVRWFLYKENISSLGFHQDNKYILVIDSLEDVMTQYQSYNSNFAQEINQYGQQLAVSAIDKIINYVDINGQGNIINVNDFNKEQLKDRLVYNYNGLTLDREVISKILMHKYGLMGWFDISWGNIVIPGLFKMPPIRYINSQSFGRIAVNGKLLENVDDTFIISVSLLLQYNQYECRNLTNMKIPNLLVDDRYDQQQYDEQIKFIDFNNVTSSTDQQDISDLNNMLLQHVIDDDIQPWNPLNSLNPSSNENNIDDLVISSTGDDSSNKVIFEIAHARIGPKLNILNVEEINLMRDIAQSVNYMWKKGWFLSKWATALSFKNGSLSCSSGAYSYPLDYILKQAGYSNTNGQEAIQYINMLIKTL